MTILAQATMTDPTRLPTPEGPGSASQAPHLPVEFTDSSGLSRAALLRRGLATGLALGGAGLLDGAGPFATRARAATEPVEAPRLPAGFTGTFTSWYIQTGDLRQHAVIGGDGPPLLLVHGWPENWYA
jgi:hypothetical protein